MSRAAVRRPPARFDARLLSGAKPVPFPGFMEPCHPTLSQEAPSGGGWLHEIKFGYRTQAHLRNGRPAIYTRAGYDRTLRFQSIADALATLPATDLILAVKHLEGSAFVVDEQTRTCASVRRCRPILPK